MRRAAITLLSLLTLCRVFAGYPAPMQVNDPTGTAVLPAFTTLSLFSGTPNTGTAGPVPYQGYPSLGFYASDTGGSLNGFATIQVARTTPGTNSPDVTETFTETNLAGTSVPVLTLNPESGFALQTAITTNANITPSTAAIPPAAADIGTNNVTYTANGEQMAMAAIYTTGTINTGGFTTSTWTGLTLFSNAGVTGGSTLATRTMLYLGGTPNVGGTNYSIYAADGGATAYFAGNVQVVGQIQPSTTAGILGTAAANNANTGAVGEFVQSLLASGSAITLSNGTTANVTSISLTAGDWDVNCNINIVGTSATETQAEACINTTSATLVSDGSEAFNGSQLTTTTATNSISPAPKRISIATTTTVYAIVNVAFSAGTVKAYGVLNARRRR